MHFKTVMMKGSACLLALTGLAAPGAAQGRAERLKINGDSFAADLGDIFERVLLEKELREAFKTKDELVGLLGDKDIFGYKLKGSISEYRQKQSRFANSLLSAARLDHRDSRLRALVEWGRETKVILPGETFGEPILSSSQRFDRDVR